MAIKNYICENCGHFLVCGNIKNAIDKFSEEAKKNLGVDITVDNCSHFEECQE